MTGMTDIEIFSSFCVPTPLPYPSITCAQWSDDGQLILCTKGAVYILTPDLGVHFDDLALLKTDRRNFHGNGSKEPSLDLGWHKNLIELDRSLAHSWSSEIQESGAVDLGSLDISWRSVTVSPGNISNVSTGSGSLLVVMSTNLELTLWRAGKNHLKEAWTKTQDITSTLKETPSPQAEGVEDRNSYLNILQAQINCMVWSQQADFGVHPNPLIDGSILALGNRAGSIILLRYDGEQNVRPIRIVRIADEWVTHLAWGPWRSSQPLHSESYLACGLANGAIVIVRIHQVSATSSGPAHSVHVDVDVLDLAAANADGKGITGLAWIDRPGATGEKPTLFHAKPGLFYFYRVSRTEKGADALTLAGEDLGTLRVRVQKTSVDSSPLYPVSGLSRIYDPEKDILVVTLFDGSFHVVHDACTSPKFDPVSAPQDTMAIEGEADNSSLTSAKLSHLARSTFVEAEGGSLEHSDVGRISGAVSFDGFGSALWLHEACRPTDFSYKADAKHNCMLVVARLWRDADVHELLLRHISETFERPRSVLSSSPTSKLRPILFHLCQRQTFDVVWPRVLGLLPVNSHNVEPMGKMTSWPGQINDDVRLAFRRSLAIGLYGWDTFQSLRLRLAVADYCWKMSPTDEIRDQFGVVAQTLLSTISHLFLKILVVHLTAVVDGLSEQELPFLTRVIVQSLLQGSPADLVDMAQSLNEVAKAKFTTAAPDAFGLTETCPACRSPIPLENLLTAICPQGHAWTRCSITSFVLATPLVRNCSGCTRKAFLPSSSRAQDQATGTPSNILTLAADPPASTPAPGPPPPMSNLWIPDAGRSWIVDELLEAVRCCVYCGNRFVRIL